MKKRIDEAAQEKMALQEMNAFDKRKKDNEARQAVYNALSRANGLSLVQLQQRAKLSITTLNKILATANFYRCDNGLYYLK